MGKSESKLSLAAFILTVLSAIVFRWEVRDVIWALWVCSLVFGYSWIVMSIIAGLISAKPEERVAGAIAGLFMLGFFSFHFGIFHLVHGMFLNQFFPLSGSVGLSKGPIVIFELAWQALEKGWPLILGTFISRWKSLPIHAGGASIGANFVKPYINVIRMHLLIFIFAGLEAVGMSHLAIFPVLAFYYFPWELVMKNKFGRTGIKMFDDPMTNRKDEE